MAYDAPSVSDFKARYPQFVALPSERVQAFLDDAERGVSKAWVERDYAPAIMLLAAHLMVSENALDGGSTTSSSDYAGPITSISVGQVKTTYGGGSSSSDGSGSSSGTGLESTEYGRRFLQLKRANFGGPMVA